MNKAKILIPGYFFLAACSTAGVHSNAELSAKPEQLDLARHFKVYQIDSTIEALQRQYISSGQAISVNEAERVYLQRFAADLQQKRKELCRYEAGQPPCP